jgi:UDP-N-acetylmuramoylalanine--D-glutamate ligase
VNRALVYGLARSGVAASAALERDGVEVVQVDRQLGNEDDLVLLDGVDVLVKSPGVPGEAALIAEAKRRGVPVWSEIELGWRLLAPRPFVGVTGTNGKTTTVELLGAIFRAAGREVAVAGNVGTPLTSIKASTDAWIICELSSFQLEDVHDFACEVAVLLNLEPDHLDRHGSFDAYRTAKLRILERARHCVVPRDFVAQSHKLVSGPEAAPSFRASQDLVAQSHKVRGDWIEFAGTDPLPAEPLIPGAHNRENAAAATAAARAAGIGDDAIAEALRTFPGVAHRLELVAERNGVRWVNDSKATNTAAARRGIAAYDAPLRLILGGSPKGEDFGPLLGELPANVRSVYLVGQSSDELAAALDAARRRYTRAETIERAVELAAAESEPGDVVLLSPACASYDQYANFEERGEDFRRLVANLPE